MNQIPSTTAILAYKVLGRLTDPLWLAWAVDQIASDITTPHLAMLAGFDEDKPLNYFEMKELTDKVLNELHLDYSDENRIIKEYVYFLINEVLHHEMSIFSVLEIIKGMYAESKKEYLEDFYEFFLNKEDLEHGESHDWKIEWGEPTQQNLASAVIVYFKKWKEEYETNHPKL